MSRQHQNPSFTALEINYSGKLLHPFTAIVSGPTGCGKTELVSALLHASPTMFEPRPVRLVWLYGKWQKKFEDLKKTLPIPKVEFRQGLENLPTNFDRGVTNVLVVDDLMDDAGKDGRMADLFTKGSHHDNLSIFFLTQNLFPRGKECRTLSVNSHYMFIFKNPRDTLQLKTLASQMYPEARKEVEEAYRDATNRPHGYLFMDLKQVTPDCVRMQTNILPGEETYAYLLDKEHKQLNKTTNPIRFMEV